MGKLKCSDSGFLLLHALWKNIFRHFWSKNSNLATSMQYHVPTHFFICLDLNLPCALIMSVKLIFVRGRFVEKQVYTQQYEELSPQTLSSSYKLWKIMAHEFSYPAKGKPLWSHKWSGAFWLVASFERSCFVVVPKKVITAMSGKYCCWYYYCATNILCFTLGFISTSG